MNHAESLGAKQLFTPLRFRCQQVFFHFAKVFFRGPAGATRWREGDVCLIFKPASRTFLPSGKISFPAALVNMATSLARTALCAFSATPSSIFPQKILRICPFPADHPTNIPERHRKMLAFFLSDTILTTRKGQLQAIPGCPRHVSSPMHLCAIPVQSGNAAHEPPGRHIFQPHRLPDQPADPSQPTHAIPPFRALHLPRRHASARPRPRP